MEGNRASPGPSRSKKRKLKRPSKKVPELVAEIVKQRDLEDNRPVIIMAQDEGRFGRIADSRSCWATKGIKPKDPSQVARAFVYVYAAVSMALGRMTSLILPHANTDMMNLFLEEVSSEFKEYFVIMLVDGARWRRSRDLRIPENVRLIQQPSHSTELNPVEYLWEELRKTYLPNKVSSMTNFVYLQVNY